MRTLPLAVALMTMSGMGASAQTYPVRSGIPPGGGSSVAYDQPLYYIQRLRPSRHYPPTRYGYVEVVGQGGSAPAGAIRLGR